MNKPTHLILDVDGVLTTGQFLYSADGGKYAKVFGPHDNDGIKLLKDHLTIQAISADKRGWPITEKRVIQDMGLKLDLVSEPERLDWFLNNTNPETTIYIGDGIYDSIIFENVMYGIAPQNATSIAKAKANFVTESKSGEGAVLDACLHILEKFFGQTFEETIKK
jgi:3-deoxy-D-manno-octulosonate 8-phosphate phosphatase (KDO 8-P phosphatase)